MALFDKFKGKTTETQMVETKSGAWKDYLDRESYAYGIAVKLLSLVGIGVAAAALPTAIPFSVVTAGIFSASYVLGCLMKMDDLQDAEKEAKKDGVLKEKQGVPGVYGVKNLGKQIIKPW